MVIARLSSFSLRSASQSTNPKLSAIALSRSQILQDAITDTLQRLRMKPFPTNPQDPWRIGWERYNQIVEGIHNYVSDILELHEYHLYSSQDIMNAVIARGYIGSAPKSAIISPPKTEVITIPAPEPAVTPPPADPVVKPPSSATIREGVIAIPRAPSTVPVVTPVVPPYTGPTLPVPVDPQWQKMLTADVPVEQPRGFPIWILLLVGGFVLLSSEDKKPRNKRGAREGRLSGTALPSKIGLTGATANCLLWQEVEGGPKEGLLWRCLKYAPACVGDECVTGTGLPKGQLRVCKRTKKVAVTSPRFKVKTVDRCAEYERLCPSDGCLPEGFEKPKASPGHGSNVKAMISDMAKQMAQERNYDEEVFGKALGREIMDRGGLRRYKGDRLKEEFAVVPLFMRRKSGQPPDEMASEMGYRDDAALLRAIRKEYPGTEKTRRRYSADQFMKEAEGIVWSHIEAGTVSGLGQQQELFPGLKRELVMKLEDPATSDDPVVACMERGGWKPARMVQLRESIAEKAVPDMFTGKTEKLDRSEKEYRTAIQKCLTASSGFAGAFGGLSTEQIAQGVREAVKENKERLKHGDTGLNAFFITPRMEIIPWKSRGLLSRTGWSTSVHSHSADNWNYLLELTGEVEPPSRFSAVDMQLFRDAITDGTIDTDVLIMGDGRMLIARCDPESDFWRETDRAIKDKTTLPQGWSKMKKYEGMRIPDALQNQQKEFFTEKGCTWEEARWRPEGEVQPMLFKNIPESQKENMEAYARDPYYEYTKDAKGNLILSKPFWVSIDPRLYPTEPAQQELFEMRQRIKESSTGRKKITWEADQPAVQQRLFGSRG